MPYHIVIRLPDSRFACADYREDIAGPMHKINGALSQGKLADPALYETVGRWLDGHCEQSAVCYAGLSPRGLPCGHD